MSTPTRVQRSARLPWLLTAALLVTGCRPPEPITTLADQQVTLGQSQTASVNVPFGGRWSIPELPEWLSVSARSGSGPLMFSLTARRTLATPLAADRPQLSGQFRVSWSSPDGLHSGSATVSVSAEQYNVTGRVLEGSSVAGQDTGIETGAAWTGGTAVSRGVIVKYRSSAGQGQPEQTQKAQPLPVQGSSSADRTGAVARELGQHRLLRAGVTVRASRGLAPGTALLRVDDLPAALAALRADPDVAYAVPNSVLRAQDTASPASPTLAAPVVPTDQYAGLQWPFRLLGYPAVWRDMEAGGYTRPVTVAVIDSGVRYDHPDLKGPLWTAQEGALDVLSNPDNGDGDGVDPDPTDPTTPTRSASGSTSSHGTHVTGLIVARWGSNATTGCEGCSTTGVVGAAYRAPVKVLPIRVIDTRGDAEEADVVSSVRYAAGLPVTLEDGKTYLNPHPAQVINLSLGGPIDAASAQPMCDAIREARDRGSLTFVAAGNAGGTVPYYPAACPAAVSVGSVSLSGGSAPIHAPYSNRYAQVQLSAPGGSDPYANTSFNGGTLNGKAFPDMVFSTSWDFEKNQPNYTAMSGTSQATPQVSALAALLLSKGLTQGPEDTLRRLLDTATDLGAAGRDDQFGVGMVNAAAALNAPAVSSTLGLRLQDAEGYVFQPSLDALGRFNAWLGDGTYRLVAGRDQDGNGIYGEIHEPRAERRFTLGEAQPRVDLGDLTPR